MIKREVKKYGGSFCIHITQEDLDRFQTKVGDFVDIEDIVIMKNEEFRRCEKCFKKFNEEDLDMVEEKWLCRDCEEVIE